MSDISDTDQATLEYLIEEGICPRFNYIALLSEEAADILDNVLEADVNQWGDDALQLTINEQSFEIPRNLTSRGTLDFLGFTDTQVEALWTFLKEVDPRASPLAPINEFGTRMIEYVDDITKSMNLRNEEGQLKSSGELLNALGLTNDVQSRPVELTSQPGLGGPGQTLQEIRPDRVLALAKRYIVRRWEFLREMDSLILSQQEGWWEKIVKGFTQSPIESIQVELASLLDNSPLN